MAAPSGIAIVMCWYETCSHLNVSTQSIVGIASGHCSVYREVSLSYSRDEIKSVVERIQNLPTLPKVAIRILELASDPEISIDELSRAIYQDPALAARVLKVANSPFYGLPRRVDSLQLALVILGLADITNIALGITILNVIRNLNPTVAYNGEKFWVHCAGCGIVARILGRKLNLRSQGADFTAGLLHDIGKIVIDEHFDRKFVFLFNKAFTHAPPVLEAERELLGESHERIGGWLADKWHLPETLSDAILYHHDLPSPDLWASVKEPRLAALSYLAEAFCEHYNVGWDGDFGYSDVRNREAWKVVLSEQDRYTTRDIDVIIKETLQSFHEARPHLLWE